MAPATTSRQPPPPPPRARTRAGRRAAPHRLGRVPRPGPRAQPPRERARRRPWGTLTVRVWGLRGVGRRRDADPRGGALRFAEASRPPGGGGGGARGAVPGGGGGGAMAAWA